MWVLLGLILVGCQATPESTLSQTWVSDGTRSVNDIHLTLSDGQPLNTDWFAGNTTVVALGYTSCPDVCPTTLSGVAFALDALAAEGVVARGLFVGVDPGRDTAGLDDYVHHFHPDIFGATGTEAALQHIADELGGAFSRTTGPEGTTVDHSTSVFIVDANARVAGYQLRPSDGESLARDVRHWALERGASIVSQDGWVRPPIPGTRVTAGYATLENRGTAPVTIVGAQSPAAGQVELHETFTEGRMAGMRATTVTIAANAAAELRPGGAHLMVFDFGADQQDVPFELTLSDGSTAWIRMPVRTP